MLIYSRLNIVITTEPSNLSHSFIKLIQRPELNLEMPKNWKTVDPTTIPPQKLGQSNLPRKNLKATRT